MSFRRRSRGRWPRLLFPKFIAGVGDPGLRPRAARPILAHCHRYAAQIASVISILLIVSCANFAGPSEVSPALIANARPDHVDVEQLQNGRKVFLSHCLEYHALPPVTKYSRNEWPHLVGRMSARANLSAGEQAAVIAYLRTASASTRY